MKQALIEMINNQDKLLDGGFIKKPVEDFVDKILLYARIQTYIVDGQIAGFIAYYCNDPKQELAFLTMLCIAPIHAGKGIGRHLLNCSIADVKQRRFSYFELEVTEGNKPAIQLYVNAGFKIIDAAEGYLKMKIQLSDDC